MNAPTLRQRLTRATSATLAALLATTAALCTSVPATAAITDTVTYYHADAAGTPVAATDESGAVLWRQTYLPYGERDYPALDPEHESTAFTGKRIDEHTGLQYFGARDYDPAIGRFTSIDPVAFTESSVHSFNRYAYANNNPYRYVDPDGEFPIVLAIWAVGAAISAYDTYQTYQNEGAAAAGKTLAVDLAITAVSGGAGKLAAKGVEKVRNYVGARNAAKATKGAKSRPYDRPSIETKSGKAVKQKDALDDWDEFLGSDQTNIDPRDGLPDPDRIWSADGKRSIRFGAHEMNSKPNKLHYHKESWSPDSVENVLQRIPQ